MEHMSEVIYEAREFNNRFFIWITIFLLVCNEFNSQNEYSFYTILLKLVSLVSQESIFLLR